MFIVDCNILLLFKMSKLADAEELEAIPAKLYLLQFEGEVNFEDILRIKKVRRDKRFKHVVSEDKIEKRERKGT